MKLCTCACSQQGSRLTLDGGGAPELGVGGGGVGAGRLRERGVDGLVELRGVGDLDPLFGGDDEDGRGLGETDAIAEGLVGEDLAGELAGGIDDKRHGASVLLEVALGEGLEVFLGADGDLVGEDGAAVVLGGLGGDLVLDVACGDGGVEAPQMHAEGEVVADDGDLVVVGGVVDEGEGACAGGALEVFELVDGDAGAGGRLDHGGVFEHRSGADRNGALGAAGRGRREEKGGGEGGGGGAEHMGRTRHGLVCILAEG